MTSDRPPIFDRVRYELVQNSGNCLEAFDCRDAALEVLLCRVAEDPRVAEDIAILEFDDDLGEAVGFIEVDPEILTLR